MTSGEPDPGPRPGSARPGRARRLRGILVDVEPLRRDRDFRLVWSGQAVSGIGNQITRIALPYQVYVLTGSTLAVAALTLVQLVPILVFALGGGSLADAVDRRRLLLVIQLPLMLSSLALAALATMPAPPLVAIYAVAFAAASFGSIDMPARASAVPRLVPPLRLPAAIALNQLNYQVASVVGPAIGGILIATVGLAGAYAVDVATFTASLMALLAIAPIPPVVSRPPGLDAIREGLRFVRLRRVILSTFVIDLNAMIFGMPTSLFPALALDVFKTGAAGFGFLSAAPSAGALVGAVLSGWVSGVSRVGRGVVIAVLVWGLAITVFGLSSFSFALALLFLAVAGGTDVISAVFRSTIVQLDTPDELRGRVSAIHSLVVTSGPRLGDIEAAAVAAVIGPQLSVITGGILCVLGVGAVVRRFPELPAHVLVRHGPEVGPPAA